MSDLISTRESVAKIVDDATRKILNGEQKLTKEYEQSVKDAVKAILDTARREAQADIVRCKDCRFLERDFNGRLHCTLYMDAHSPWAESRYEPKPDDFCSKAERRTDA